VKATRKARSPRKGAGKRSVQALEYIQATPGVTIPELAVKMGIKQNYLYRVLPDLEREGSVKKDGRGWHPASAEPADE
jgi:DNA-binding IclR family transcriptional regulator